MKTATRVLAILLTMVFLCAAPTSFSAHAQTTLTFTVIPEESPVITTGTLKYLGVELLTETQQKNLEGSVQVVLDPTTGTLHTIQVVSADVKMSEPISFTASRDVSLATVELTVLLTSITITLTGESTATLVDASGMATISLHEIQVREVLDYEYTIDPIIGPDVTENGTRTLTHTYTEPFTLTISPVTDVDDYTTLTLRFHRADSFTEDFGDGFSGELEIDATITAQFNPPPRPVTAVKDFDLYGRFSQWGLKDWD